MVELRTGDLDNGVMGLIEFEVKTRGGGQKDKRKEKCKIVLAVWMNSPPPPWPPPPSKL